MHKVFVMLAVVIIAAAIFYPYQRNELPTPEVKSAQSKNTDVPELKDILNPSDQTLRLTAARKLVERVGVEEALEILEHSTLPHTGEGHLAVHQIGFHAYKLYGPEAI